MPLEGVLGRLDCSRDSKNCYHSHRIAGERGVYTKRRRTASVSTSARDSTHLTRAERRRGDGDLALRYVGLSFALAARRQEALRCAVRARSTRDSPVSPVSIWSGAPRLPGTAALAAAGSVRREGRGPAASDTEVLASEGLSPTAKSVQSCKSQATAEPYFAMSWCGYH